jgi:hypothetical protein
LPCNETQQTPQTPKPGKIMKLDSYDRRILEELQREAA